VAAEESINLENKTLAKLYHECKDYIIAMYQRDLSKESLNDICQVKILTPSFNSLYELAVDFFWSSWTLGLIRITYRLLSIY
jgi:hypothetical protein